ncbi:MAG: hypothetical protein ACLQIQ_21840 [Beijerinckiaceae bacterium]
MPQESKRTVQRLCLEAVRQCGPNAREIISFVKARISEMNEEDRLELDRDVRLLLSFEPPRRTPPH